MADLTLAIRLKADGSDLVGTVRLAKGELDGLGNAGAAAGHQASQGGREAKRALDDLGSTARSLKSTAAGLGLGIGLAQVTREFVEANTKMQAINATLTAVTGSARGAAAELSYIRGESERLGIGIAAAARQLSQLQAASEGTRLAGAGARQVFSDLASAARVLHLSEADLGGVITAATQMLGKQTVAAEELRGQMAERIPGAMAIAAKAMGVTTAQLGDMIEKGQVLAEDFLPKFAATLKDKFAGGLQDATQGLQAESQRLGTAIFEGLIKIGEGGALQALTDGIRSVTSALASPEAAEGAKLIGAGIKLAADHLNVLAAAAAAYAAARLAPVLLESVAALGLYARTLAAVATGQAALLTGATGLAGIISLIGGWPVVIAGAVAALVAFSATETKADTVSKSYADAIDKVVDAKKRLTSASGEAKSAIEAEIQGTLLVTRYALEGQIEKAAEKFRERTANMLPGLRDQLYAGTYGFDVNGAETAGKALRDLHTKLIELRAVAGEYGTEESPEFLRGLQAWATGLGSSNSALDAAAQRMKELTEKTLPAVKAADELVRAKKDLKLLLDNGRISLDQYNQQLGALEEHYRATLVPLSEFLDKLERQAKLSGLAGADLARAQALEQYAEAAKKANTAVTPEDQEAVTKKVNESLAGQQQLAQQTAEATLQFERQKAAAAGNAQAIGAISAKQETYNQILKTEGVAAAEVFRTTGQLSEAGQKYLGVQLQLNAAKAGPASVEYLRNLTAEIAANERLAAATLQGAAAVAEAEKQNRIENEVLKQGEGARATITEAENKLEESRKKRALAPVIADLKRQIDATKALAQATGEGAAAVEEANIKNQLAETLAQLKIASGTEEAKVIEELIRQLHGYAQALDAANAIKGAQANLERLQKELSLSGEIERVRTRELALYDARKVVAEQGAKWTDEEKQRYLALAGTIADTRGELAEIARERELWLEPFKNAVKGIQDAFTGAFEAIFSGGVKSFGDLADTIKQVFIKLAAQIATLMVFRPVLGGVLSALGASPSVLAQLGLGSYAGGGAAGAAGAAAGSSLSSLSSLASAGSLLTSANPFGFADTFASANLPGVFTTTRGFANITEFQALDEFGAVGAGTVNAGFLPFSASQALPVIGAALPGLLSGNYAQAGLGAAGAIAGSFILPGVGTVVGGIIGNLLGGLFGKKPTSGPNAGATIGVGDAGRLSILKSGADNNGDVQTAINLAEGAIKGLTRTLRELGATVTGFSGIGAPGDTGLEVGYHKGKYFVKAHDEDFTAANNSYEKPEDAVSAFIVRALKEADLSGLSADIATALAHSTATDLDALWADIDFARGFRDQIKVMEAGLNPATAQLAQLNSAAQKFGRDTSGQIEDFAAKANELGLATRDEVLPALRAMLAGLLGLAQTEKPLSGVALAMETFRLNAQALKPALEAVGYSAEDAQRRIDKAIDANANAQGAAFTRGLNATLTPAIASLDQAKAVYEELQAQEQALVAAGKRNAAQAAADSALINQIIARQINQALSGLGGSADDFARVVEAFKGGADEFSKAVLAAADSARSAAGSLQAAISFDPGSALQRLAEFNASLDPTGAQRALGYLGQGQYYLDQIAAVAANPTIESVANLNAQLDWLAQKVGKPSISTIGPSGSKAGGNAANQQDRIANDNRTAVASAAGDAIETSAAERRAALRVLLGGRLTNRSDYLGVGQQELLDTIEASRAAASQAALAHVPDWIADRRGLTLSATVNDLGVPRSADQRGVDLVQSVNRIADPMARVADGIDRVVRLGSTERTQAQIRDALVELVDLVQSQGRTGIGASSRNQTAGGTQTSGAKRLVG